MADRNHQLLTIELGDDPDAWRGAGFTVDGDSLTLGSTTIRCTGTGPGFTGWALAGVDEPIDGILACAPRSAPAEPHPNGISRIDHVVVTTGDRRRTVAALTGAGLEVRGSRSAVVAGRPARQTFLWAGDVIIELVGPDDGEPTTDDAATVWGLALVAEDLDAAAAMLGDHLGTPRDAVQPGRRIAGLRVGPLGIGVPVAVMSPHVPT
jgi:hypothetical protein